ncbi:MAG: autotransporter-associated beta strand repeat-containing protein [Verrucomicrobiae bacterium]|nr:autotransporter-associated beta strand repeat-containing protein [Verrucomicrobiae bacterium]
MPSAKEGARRRTIRMPSGIVVGFAFSLLAANGQVTSEPGFPAGIHLPAKARGEAAIAALGARLPEVAAFHGKSPQQLRKHFRSDPSLWVDEGGELFFACPPECGDCAKAEAPEAGPTAESIEPTDPPPYDTSEAFLLHSRPGANRVIYLDFDGHVDNTPGWWKDGASAPAYNIPNSNPANFSAEELNRIIEIWQRVAEDYSMYEIDVTTEEPDIEDLKKTSSDDARYGIRVVIGGSGNDWYGNNVGGVAFVGSFDLANDVPCWVFPAGSGYPAKNIAEAASHEAGHTLGLLHDGVEGGASYYSGQGHWVPIMGVSYDKPISQWSKGEYADANNTQDDLAVMLTQGAVYRADDHGGTISSATKLSSDSTTVSAGGVIERRNDLDYFHIESAGGSLAVNVNPAHNGANLRLEVKLYNASNTLLQTANSADTADGTQPVTLETSVTPGVYYVSVDGIGNGDPLTTGYTDYASLGQYTVTITGVLPDGFTWLTSTGGAQQWNTANNWASGNLPTGAAPVVRINNNIWSNQTIQLASATSIGRLFLGDSNSTHGFTFTSTGGSMVFRSPAELSKTLGGNDSITAPVALVAPLVLTQSASGTLSFSGGISGAGGITKEGAGMVVFSTANTYTGATKVAGGLLRLDNSNGLPGGIDHTAGAGESPLLFKGGVLGLHDDFTRPLGTGAGQLNWDPQDGGAGSGGFAAFGADRMVKLNNNTNPCSWYSAIIGNGNTLILGHSTATHTLDFRNGVNFSGGKRTVQVENGEAAVDAILSGVLADYTTPPGSLNKTGPGVLSLTNANSYNGSTTVDGGVLRLDHAGALPNGNLELVGGGILGLGAGDLTNRTVGTGNDQVQWLGSGGFAAFGETRTVKFSDSSINWNAADFIGGGRTLVLSHETADATLVWQQKISLAGSARTIQVEDGTAMIDARMSGVIAGGTSGTNNSLVKGGAGTLALTAQNTHWGPTIVGAGTLMIGDGGTAGGVSQNSQNITVETGALLAVNRSDTLTQGTDPMKPAITGGGGFSQAGTGNTVLMLPNTYLGPTMISSGTLTLGASGVLPDGSAVSIGDATLATGSFSETAATLEITGEATIQLAAGAVLSFANSSVADWSGGTLHLTGTIGSGSSMRFGTGGNGLTPSQLERISADGFTGFALDSNGFLTAEKTTGYTAWAVVHAPTGAADDDFDHDGVPNGVEYVLGGGKHTNDLAKLPNLSTDGGILTFTFERDQASIDGSTSLEIQLSSDVMDWSASYPVPDDASAGDPGPSVTKNVRPGFDRIVLSLPIGAETIRFVRLKVTP